MKWVVALFYDQFANFADGIASSMTLMHTAPRLEKAWHWEQEKIQITYFLLDIHIEKNKKKKIIQILYFQPF